MAAVHQAQLNSEMDVCLDVSMYGLMTLTAATYVNVIGN